MEGLYKEVAGRLVNRRHCVALTGAGISAESGIATFRSNPQKAFPAADFYIQEKSGAALSGIVQEVKKLKNSIT